MTNLQIIKLSKQINTLVISGTSESLPTSKVVESKSSCVDTNKIRLATFTIHEPIDTGSSE